MTRPKHWLSGANPLLIGCLIVLCLTGSLRQCFSLYRAVPQRDGAKRRYDREEKRILILYGKDHCEVILAGDQ